MGVAAMGPINELPLHLQATIFLLLTGSWVALVVVTGRYLQVKRLYLDLQERLKEPPIRNTVSRTRARPAAPPPTHWSK